MTRHRKELRGVPNARGPRPSPVRKSVTGESTKLTKMRERENTITD